MPAKRGHHRRTVTLPKAGAIFDVSEEKGDGAARQFAHHPSPTVPF
jgi:hypothetical protein